MSSSLNRGLDWEALQGGEFCWYALETRHRCEKKVVEQLARVGIETFLPQRREVHRWSDRNKPVTIPLFAGYAFVKLDRSRATRLRVLQTSGVLGFVSSRGKAAPVPTEQVENLRKLLRENVPCSLHAFLRAGQRVRVRGGCLDGVEGIYVDADSKELIVSIECLQRSVAVRVEGYELELV
jgi:transcription antitermination factor NusG